MKEDKKIRVDTGFDDLIKRISKQRIVRNKDNIMRGSRRITKAMRRHIAMAQIEKDIINADLETEPE